MNDVFRLQKRKWLNLVRYTSLGVCGACIVAMLTYFAHLPNALDPQGGESRGCMNEDLPPSSNGAGMVATGHETWCDDLFVHDGATYIYVHKLGEQESRRSLVFRFGNSDRYEFPKLEWLNSSTLSVTVGTVAEVTKQVDSTQGIRILYSIGKEEYPRDDWARYLERQKHIAVGAGVLFLLCMFLFGFLIRSIKVARRRPN